MPLRVESIIANRVAEGDAWDFKQSIYSSSDSDVVEFLKDVTSFANAGGGTILLGVQTDEAGRASNAVGVSATELDKEILRLEQILRDSVEPDVTGAVRISDETNGDGRHFVFIDIDASALAPHRIIRKGKFKSHFFVRRGRRSEEADVFALRELFEGRQRIGAMFQSFVDERIGAIRRGEYPSGQEGVPQLLIHVGPQRSFGSRRLVDFLLEKENHFLLVPTIGSGYRARPNIHGVISRNDDVRNPYNQSFNNGCVEMLRQAFTVSQTEVRSGIHGPTLAGFFSSDLPQVLRVLTQLYGEDAFLVATNFLRVPPVNLVHYPRGYETFLPNSAPSSTQFRIPSTIIRTSSADLFEEDIQDLLDMVWRAWGQDGYTEQLDLIWRP